LLRTDFLLLVFWSFGDIGRVMALLGLSFAPSFADDAAETKAIVDHHLAAFGAGDMKEVLADYTEKSVIHVPGAEFRGKAAIEQLFAGLFAEFAKPGASFNLANMVIEGEIGYIVWSAETADNVYELGTDTYLVEDGKIMVQTLVTKVIPKNK
jgi:ketosteroid isomerase-like protein